MSIRWQAGKLCPQTLAVRVNRNAAAYLPPKVHFNGVKNEVPDGGKPFSRPIPLHFLRFYHNSCCYPNRLQLRTVVSAHVFVPRRCTSTKVGEAKNADISSKEPPESAADTELMMSSAAIRITAIGAFVNVGLSVIKYVAGSLTNSSALMADAAHSLSDLLSDFITLFVVKAARDPPDADHPYGHGRYEAVGSLCVSTILCATGSGLCWNSLARIQTCLNTGEMECELLSSGYGNAAIGACLVSLISKELLYHATARVGNEIGSQTLVANAWHHRSDALSSVAALVGVGGCLAGAPILDPVAGVVVSGLVIQTGMEIGWEALQEVTDRVDHDDATSKLVRIAASETDGVMGIERLRARKMGPYHVVDVQVLVDPRISVSAARNVAQHLRKKVQSADAKVSEVVVQVVPYQAIPNASGSQPLMRSHAELEDEVHTALEDHERIRAVANVTCHYVPGKGVNLKVSIIVDFKMTVRQARQVAREAKEILMELPGVYSVDIGLELLRSSDFSFFCSTRTPRLH